MVFGTFKYHVQFSGSSQSDKLSILCIQIVFNICEVVTILATNISGVRGRGGATLIVKVTN